MTAIATRKVLAQSFRFVGRNINHVATAAFIPVVLYALLATLIDLVDVDLKEEGAKSESILWSIVSDSLELLFVPFFVGWHRITLLASATVRFRTFLDAGMRDMRYGGFTLIVMAPLTAYVAAITAITDDQGSSADIAIAVIGIVAILVSIWLTVRLTFVFVETAIDRPTSLRTGWRESRGHGWALLVLIVCISGAALLLVGLKLVAELIAYGDAFPGLLISGMDNLFLAAVTAVFGAVWVSAMSYAYRDATGYVPPDVDTLF